MPGFRGLKAWVDAATDNGKNWLACFRKVPPSATTIAGQWFDYSTAAGFPVPNYYASTPGISATIEGAKGIWLPTVAPERQYVRRMVTMTGAASVTGTTNQNQTYILLDYLLYYPFFDLDAAGDEQLCDNKVSLPRYSTGDGVKMMLVAQAPTIGGGNLTVRYTNQDGTQDRVTQVQYCAAAQPSGALVQSAHAAAGVQPFVTLQAGDTGVRSVQSLTVGVANGGLCAIVLVKPLMWAYNREECRRPTSSPTESYGDAAEIERIRSQAGAPQILDGAYLSFIGRGAAGSLASSQLVGTIETVWS